jgi:hypothetical protein
MSLHDADTVFNEFISDSSRGTVLYHDHFVGRAGGIAIFHVNSESELRQLQNESCLKWMGCHDISSHFYRKAYRVSLPNRFYNGCLSRDKAKRDLFSL